MNRTLIGISILAGLSEASLLALERRCLWKTFEPAQGIIGHGDPSSDVYFMVSGHAEVIIYSASGRQVGFRDVKNGDTVGEFAAIDGRPRSAAVEARSQCLVAALEATEVLLLLKEEPSVTFVLLQQIIGRHRELTDRTFELSALAVKNRIHAELLRLVRKGEVQDSKAQISPVPTHDQIANRVATNRESVTRELQRLTQSGLIARTGRTLLVNDVARLERMVRDVSPE